MPALVFANARSINNKTDEVASLIGRHGAFKNARSIGIIESWLDSDINDSLVDGPQPNNNREKERWRLPMASK